MDIISKSENLNNKCDFVEQVEQIYKMIINNDRYIFKPASKDMGVPFYELCFNELLVSYIAKYLKIDCVNVKFASYNPTNNRFKNEYGILMQDYNIKGYVSYLGSYFLEKYYKYLKEKNKLNILGLEYDSKEDALEKMNNLKTIYASLMYFFSDYDNKEKIVKDLMNDLAKIMCLDFFTMQNDRSMNNWGILLSVKNPPKLIKMYDNEMSFMKDYVLKLKVSNSNETKKETLMNFLQLNEIYKNYFCNIYNNLPVEKISEILELIELENGTFPKSYKTYKEKVLENYAENYEFITKILNNVESRDNYAR